MDSSPGAEIWRLGSGEAITTETLRAQRELSVTSASLWSGFGFGCARWTTNQWILLPAQRFGGWEAGETITTARLAATKAALRAPEISPQRRRGHGDISVLSVSLWWSSPLSPRHQNLRVTTRIDGLVVQ